MATAHAAPGELVDVRGPARTLGPESSETLVRTRHLEVFRYGLSAGKVIGTHAAAGLMVVQCIEGIVEFTALGKTQRLTAGTLLYLPDGEAHSLTAVTNALLLITIVLRRI